MTTADCVIWKYKLELPTLDGTVATVRMPHGSTPLSVGNQNEELVVWAECDPRPAQNKTDYRFACVMTGRPVGHLAKNRKFLGTVTFEGGAFVLHVYWIHNRPGTL